MILGKAVTLTVPAARIVKSMQAISVIRYDVNLLDLVVMESSKVMSNAIMETKKGALAV